MYSSCHNYCKSLPYNCLVFLVDCDSFFFPQGRQGLELVISKINKEVQDLATNIEQATSRLNTELGQAASRLNTEFEQAKQGFEQATRLPQAMCEGKSTS